MEKDNTHRTPNYAGWAGLDGIDLKKDIEQLVHIEHDIEKIKSALYHEKRVLNHAYYHDEEEHDDNKQKEIFQMKLHFLHDTIMHEIILFCKENNINAERFNIHGDMLQESIKQGVWHPSTDSCLCMFDSDEELICESL